MKIMVCYDGSDKSKNALEKTMEFFGPQKPEIMLLMIAEEPGDASMENEEASDSMLRACHDELREAAERLAEQGFETDVVLATGEPRNMIIKAVESKSPDLVVVAKRGRGSVDTLLLGSVSTYVVRHSRSPVLVIQNKA